LSRDG